MKISKYKKAMRPKNYLTHDFVVYKGEPYKLENAKTNFSEVDEEKGWQRFPDYLDGLDLTTEPKVRRNQDDNE